MERFVAKINAADPDIVLIAGDILEGARWDEDTGKFEAQFRRLHPKCEVYVVPGNHDEPGSGRTDHFERAEAMTMAGVRKMPMPMIKLTSIIVASKVGSFAFAPLFFRTAPDE